MTSRSIHNDNLIVVLSEVRDTSLSNLDWVSLILITIEWTLNLCCIHLELGERASSESISTDDTNSPSLPHVVESELGTGGSLTSSLETNKHYDIGLVALEFISLILAGKHTRKLINYSFLDESTQIGTSHIF